MQIQKFFIVAQAASITCLLFSNANAVAAAGNFYWFPQGIAPAFLTPKQGCDYEYSSTLSHLVDRYRPQYNTYTADTPPTAYKCALADAYGNWTGDYFGMIIARNVDCSDGMSFDKMTGQCGYTADKGPPLVKLSCPIGNFNSDSFLNPSIGNSYLQQSDLDNEKNGRVSIYRYYNSIDATWRHSYSDRLDLLGDVPALTTSEGKEIHFTNESSPGFYASEAGILKRSGSGWTYLSRENSALEFDSDGALASVTDSQGHAQKITRREGELTISDHYGMTVSISEDYLHQPTHITAPSLEILYNYRSGNLKSVKKVFKTGTTSREFLYEDTRAANVNRITGIVDERNLRLGSWNYDGLGRVISVKYGIEGSTVALQHNSDGSTIVTNELGKTTVYHYQQIGGIKRISSIDGEPSVNCPASNSRYTYSDRGQVLTKTDAKGFITTYSYNDRGLETSRTEASGTPQARVTTTEWDPTRFLRTKVVDPYRATVYTYDDEGRETGRQVSAR